MALSALLGYIVLRLQNDLYCVGWGIKLYSLTHAIKTNIVQLKDWY